MSNIQIKCKNAVMSFKITTLPDHYDYIIYDISKALPSGISTGEYYINTTKANGANLMLVGQADPITYSSGTIFKINDNLYLEYKNETFTFLTMPSKYSTINVTEFEDGIYTYNASSGFTKGTNSSFVCASVQVKQGDIVLYSGQGGSGARLWGIDSNGTYKVSTENATSGNNPTQFFVVESDGTLYYNSMSAVTHSVEIRRLKS